MKIEETELWKNTHNYIFLHKKENLISTLIKDYNIELVEDSILESELFALIYLMDFDIQNVDLNAMTFEGFDSKFVIMFILLKKGYIFRSDQEALYFICEGLALCHNYLHKESKSSDIVNDVYTLFSQYPYFFEENEVKKYLHKSEFQVKLENTKVASQEIVDYYFKDNFLNLPTPLIKYF